MTRRILFARYGSKNNPITPKPRKRAGTSGGHPRARCEMLEERRLLSVDVLTYHGDNARTGANLAETTLTPTNVNSTDFGQLFNYSVDGQVVAQPLVVSGLAITNQGTHDVVFVATEHDSVYAFDADSDLGTSGQPLWHVSFLNAAAGITSVPASDTGTGDIVPEVGITGTPVIDRATNTLYVVSNTKTTDPVTHAVTYQQDLHALDLSSGAEKFGGPTLINFTTTGSGGNNTNGVIPFDPLIESQRPGLTLANGSVYIAWASHGDNGDYHGLLAAYSASTLQFESALNLTADGYEGGVWMSGDAPAVDSAGNLYLSIGNGTFDNGGADYGDSLVKISGSFPLTVLDSFTPFNQLDLDHSDTDYGSGGVILLSNLTGPTANEVISGGKDGNLYVANADNLGGFGASANANLQTFSLTSTGGIYSTPAYYNGTLYEVAENRGITSQPITNGVLASPTAEGSTEFGFPGATPTLSANGNTDGIAWVIQYGQSAVLRAYDASDLNTELYDSNQQAGRDQLGVGVKFAVPTVANGEVFVGTGSSLAVFGLLNSQAGTPPASPTNLAATVIGPTDVHLTWTESSNDTTTFLIQRSTDGVNFTQVGSAGAGVDNFEDTSAIVGTTYTYRVLASNSAGTSGASNVVTASTPAVAGLVGYWQFNEGIGTTTADASGFGDDGSLSGETTWSDGRIGSASLNFHGAGVQDAHVEIPNAPQLQFGAADSFSIGVWVKANALDSKWAGIVTKSTDIAPGYGFYLDPSNHWAFATSSGQNVIEGPLADTSWHYLTLVQNGAAGTRQLFLDGALVGTGSAEQGNGAGALWIGGSKSTNAEYFNGSVDDLRIYNRTLSATEIAAFAGTPATPLAGTATIAGVVYTDENENGTQDSDEAGVSGVLVYLDLDDNGSLSPNEPVTITDSLGRYSFSALSAGTYRVTSVASNEDHFISPSTGFSDVTLADGQAVTAIDFGQTDNTSAPNPSQFALSLASKLPGAALGGTNGTVSLRVRNTSKVLFKAPLSLSIFISSSTFLTSSAVLAAPTLLTSPVSIKPGQSKVYKFKFMYPATLGAGTYQLLGSVIANKSVGETQSTIASGPIQITPPTVSLQSAFPGKPVRVKEGKSTTATLRIVNSGNVAATGTAEIQLFASGDAALDDSDTLLNTIGAKLKIKAHKSGSYRLRFTAPADLAPGSYYLIAKVDSSTAVTDVNAASDQAAIITRA